MNGRVRLAALTAGLLAIVLLVAAGCYPPTPPAAVPSDPNQITGIVWEWTSLTNQSTKQTETIANPENYTITFNTDGALSGKADCNTFTGAYAQENGFVITLGATSMAYCGDASLDQKYLQLLSRVVAGGPDGQGNLALETPGGAERMLFRNGGPAPK
jgi:heat shock protein HslJ